MTAADDAAAVADSIGTLTDGGKKIIQNAIPYSGWRDISQVVTGNEIDDNCILIRRIGHGVELALDFGFNTATELDEYEAFVFGNSIPAGYRALMPISFNSTIKINGTMSSDDGTTVGNLSISGNTFNHVMSTDDTGTIIGEGVCQGYLTWKCTDDIPSEWPGVLLG